MKHGFACVLFSFCLLLLCVVPVKAEHTPEHRFTISGYVYDETGKPFSGTVVVRDAAGNFLATTDTSGSGYYAIRLHLHNSNLGDRLLIHSPAGKKELIVQFDPNDKTTERGAEVNFGAVPLSSWLRDNGAAVFLGALLLTAGTAYVASRRRKNQKRHQSKKKTRQGRETSH